VRGRLFHACRFLLFNDNRTFVGAWPKKQHITIILAHGLGDEVSIALHELQNGDPSPEPDPDPEPLPPSELWGIVIEESKNRTPEQAIVMAAPAVRALFPDGRFRVVDPIGDDGKRADIAENMDSYADIAMTKLNQWPMLFLVSPKGDIYYQGELPKTVDAMVELIEQKKGGAK
jgi:hypothetical protein